MWGRGGVGIGEGVGEGWSGDRGRCGVMAEWGGGGWSAYWEGAG